MLSFWLLSQLSEPFFDQEFAQIPKSLRIRIILGMRPKDLFFAIPIEFAICAGQSGLEGAVENCLSALLWRSEKEPNKRIKDDGHDLLERAHSREHVTA